MNVLHVAPSFHPAVGWGGPIKALYELCNALAAKKELTLKVLTTDSAGPQLHERVQTSRFPERYEGYDVYFCRRWWGNEISPRLVCMLNSLVPWADVVHITATYSFPVIPTLIACAIHKKPVVWSPRGALQAWESEHRRWIKTVWNSICRCLLPTQFILHCTSQKEASESAMKLGIVNATAVIPNGVVIPAECKPQHATFESTTKVLFMGLISPKKALENLVEAIVIMRNENIELNVYGAAAPGYEEYYNGIVEEVKRGGHSALVKFHGFVAGQSKVEAFLSADMCVVPSHSENFCNVVAEALSYGLPVIASKGIPWPGLNKNECGISVENRPLVLAEAIRDLRSRNLDAMGKNGREWMIRDFSWTSVADAMHQEYCRLVQEV